MVTIVADHVHDRRGLVIAGLKDGGREAEVDEADLHIAEVHLDSEKPLRMLPNVATKRLRFAPYKSLNLRDVGEESERARFPLLVREHSAIAVRTLVVVVVRVLVRPDDDPPVAGSVLQVSLIRIERVHAPYVFVLVDREQSKHGKLSRRLFGCTTGQVDRPVPLEQAMERIRRHDASPSRAP